MATRAASDSFYYTVFHANNKLFLYTRLIMGVRPSQSDLNAALRPMFAQTPHDLIIAIKTNSKNKDTPLKGMEAI